MIAAYSLDKQLATFLGRPPLISWRYCNIQLPLDLSYDEIVADPATRDAAIAKLEANNGWNTEGNPGKGGWARAILTASIVREKVLELSLCHQADDLAQKVECVGFDLTLRLLLTRVELYRTSPTRCVLDCRSFCTGILNMTRPHSRMMTMFSANCILTSYIATSFYTAFLTDAPRHSRMEL